MPDPRSSGGFVDQARPVRNGLWSASHVVGGSPEITLNQEPNMNAAARPALDLKVPDYVKNPRLVAWVSDMVALCKPAAIHWCDGSQSEYDQLCQRLVEAGTFRKLNPAKRPNSCLVRPQRRGPR